MQKGDIVARISYNQDVMFIITDIKEEIASLQGLYIRLVADSPLADLVKIDNNNLRMYEEKNRAYESEIIDNYKKKLGHITGKILHLDSDELYLDKCLKLYNSLDIYAEGILIKEEAMSEVILEKIDQYRPSIVVLTGHDSYNNKGIEDLKNYKNTLNFLKTVVKIRSRYALDDICIFAGACGSNAEALIASGANFASSFDRRNIEAYDPAIVAVLVAITPFDKIVDIDSIYNFSKMEKGSIGGIETFGKMRLLVRWGCDHMVYEKAFAKINIALEVLQKVDGYHKIRNIMVPINLYDELFIEKSKHTEIICDADIENNICLKAIELFKEKFNITENVKITINKNIPIMAGLAGGSTDAAATLKGLNRLFEVNASTSELYELAKELGSDVPFFLYNKPSLCTGRGEVINFLNFEFKNVPVLIIKPNFGLSTKEVYANYVYDNIDDNCTIEKIIKAMEEKDINLLDELIFNDLENVAIRIEPRLKEIFDKISGLSYIPHVSGSGPSIYILNAKTLDMETIKNLDDSLELHLCHTL